MYERLLDKNAVPDEELDDVLMLIAVRKKPSEK